MMNGENDRIADLIYRLTGSGGTTLEIGIALNPASAEYEYRIEWTSDGWWTSIGWDKDFKMALEKCADDAQL